MSNLINSFKSAALSVGEYFTPVLQESKFKETGVLTPEEFVAAGDFLVHHCPTWAWAKAASADGKRDYLPEDKQFLLSKHVPCHRRYRELAYDADLEKVLDDENDGQEGWISTHHFAADDEDKALDIDKILQEEAQHHLNVGTEDDDEPGEDMEAFMNADAPVADDPYRFDPPADAFGEEDAIKKTRTYDLHITYDKYYQVPRFWLHGYDENRKYLTVQQMYEDFSQDHSNKTITMETHPHLGVQMASIHPCRHAEVMKRLFDQLQQSNKEFDVHTYLIIFLKFVQAIIPTIEYDFTRSVSL